MPQNYEHINKHEREIIAEMRGNGKGWDAIAAFLVGLDLVAVHDPFDGGFAVDKDGEIKAKN